MKYKLLDTESLSIYGYSKMPNALFKNPELKKLSNDAKILITLLLDLALQSNLIDEDGHIYILYSTKKIMNTLNISKNTVTKRLDELEDAGLIVCPDRSKGRKEFLIYVTDFSHNSTSNISKSERKESKNENTKNTNNGKEVSQIKGKSNISYKKKNIYRDKQTDEIQTTDCVVETETRNLFKVVPNLTDTDIQAILKEANGDLERCQKALATIPSSGVTNAVGFLISSVRYGWKAPIPILRNKASGLQSSGYMRQTYNFDELQKIVNDY